MPKIKQRHATLSGLVDSDSEADQFVDAMPTPDSAAENRAPAKKARGRPKAAPGKVTKTKAPARRTSGRLNAKAINAIPAAKAKGKRPALADKTNQQYASETEEVDDFDAEGDVMEGVEDSLVEVKQAKPKATKIKATTTGRGKAAKEVAQPAMDIDATPEAPKPQSRTTKKNGPSKKEVPAEQSPEKVVMETQVQAMDIDTNEEEEDAVRQSMIKTARKVARASSSSSSRHRQPSAHRRPAGNASDTERNDPALRRKLGEMTKKYENLHIRYQDLREIGIKEAERNIDRMKKTNDTATKQSTNTIATLKDDVAAQAALAKAAKGLKKQLESQKDEIASLRAQIAKMTTSLSEAQSENQTLSAKLAANRTAAASVESTNAKTPNHAKANGGIRMVGSAEAAQVAQAAQLKEDIYSDLTGLIIRSVKRETEEDVFDCIQTGRNGTLHFKLAAANEKSADSYDDAQCSYIPQLDPSRDSALMDLLPDYLVDEITFPRPQAAKFYARVVKALTEKTA